MSFKYGCEQCDLIQIDLIGLDLFTRDVDDIWGRRKGAKNQASSTWRDIWIVESVIVKEIPVTPNHIIDQAAEMAAWESYGGMVIGEYWNDEREEDSCPHTQTTLVEMPSTQLATRSQPSSESSQGD